MCAIAGLFGVSDMSAARLDIERLLGAMRHRGPDDTGAWFDDSAGVALGHNRLSIIDLSAGGHQPMVNAQTGDALIFNGEIYNHLELRAELVARGETFSSRSDTEVLLKSIDAWGLGCLHRLKGMYAFACWRPREQTLYLARDPMGVKPLYYGPVGDGRFAFASEIRALRALAGVATHVDRAALGQFLEFGYTFENERTIFSDVKKLPPGSMAVLKRGAAPVVKQFFQPQTRSDQEHMPADIESELFETLDSVVEQHLIADTPVGILLSGGLDSSLIAALAARRTRLRTLTMAFEGGAVDERAHARRVADFIGAQNEEVLIGARELRQGIDESVSLFDDLFSDWGALSTRLLYKKAGERGLKVVLVGEGADELFGGYDVFRAARSKWPTELWLLHLYRVYAGQRYGSQYRVFRQIMRHYLDAAGGDRFDAIRLFETRRQLPNNYVMKVDKASMSVGVEARVPFLDQRVAEIAYRIPAQMLLDSGSEKRLLREMARRRGLLPRECLERKKFGSAIAASWMDQGSTFQTYARDVILASGGWTEALGFRTLMEDFFLRNRTGRRFPHPVSIFRNLAWRLLLLELWSKALGVTANAD